MIADFAGNLAGLTNVVPGKNLTFIPMLDVGPVPLPAGLPYTVQFNPEQYEQAETLVVIPRTPQGEADPEMLYDSTQGETFSFQLMIDGTGAAGNGKKDVMAELHLLRQTIGFNGLIHMPNYLVVVWGRFIRTAICEGITVKYTLFSDDGTPKRATVILNFRKHTPKVLSLLKLDLRSPDLTHRRSVRETDRIDLICQHHYNDKTRYLEVAKANGLTSFRFLKPGTTLDLPPVEKSAQA